MGAHPPVAGGLRPAPTAHWCLWPMASLHAVDYVCRTQMAFVVNRLREWLSNNLSHHWPERCQMFDLADKGCATHDRDT